MESVERLAYSITEATVYLGFARDKVYEEIRAGRLRAKKAGRRTLILASDLNKYLASLPDLELGGPETEKMSNLVAKRHAG